MARSVKRRGLADTSSHGPLPTAVVTAHTLEEAGWAVRVLADNASSVGRWPIAWAVAACVLALLGLPFVEVGEAQLGALVPLGFLGLLLSLVGAFIVQASRGAEPIFKRLRLDRRGLVLDEIRGDWTLTEDELLTAEGVADRSIRWDDLLDVVYKDEEILVERRDGEVFAVTWMPPFMAEEVVTHLSRTLRDREDTTVAAERQAALQRLAKSAAVPPRT